MIATGTQDRARAPCAPRTPPPARRSSGEKSAPAWSPPTTPNRPPPSGRSWGRIACARLELLRGLRSPREPCRGAQRVGVQQLAIEHDHARVAQIADALGGIAVDEHQVRCLAGLDR